jgi:hypothetical protein
VHRAEESHVNPLLTAIVVWLSTNFGLPATFEHPRIEFVRSDHMAAFRYQSLLPARNGQLSVANDHSDANHRREVVAVYSDAHKTIYLPEGWTGRTAAELSILVHEMVHHLQNSAGTTYDCPRGREKLAYKAQSEWLQLFGRSLETDFDIDPMTLLVTTTCELR